jgi:hypothetical protein
MSGSADTVDGGKPNVGDYSGWLSIKGNGPTEWCQRFFVLAGTTLRCFDSEAATHDHLLAVFELGGGQVTIEQEVMLLIIHSPPENAEGDPAATEAPRGRMRSFSRALSNASKPSAEKPKEEKAVPTWFLCAASVAEAVAWAGVLRGAASASAASSNIGELRPGAYAVKTQTQASKRQSVKFDGIKWEGWIMKKCPPKKLRSMFPWKKRWFVLHHDILTYQKSPDDDSLDKDGKKRSVPLSCCAVSEVEASGGPGGGGAAASAAAQHAAASSLMFNVVPQSPEDRVFELQAESKAEYMHFVSCLNTGIFLATHATLLRMCADPEIKTGELHGTLSYLPDKLKALQSCGRVGVGAADFRVLRCFRPHGKGAPPPGVDPAAVDEGNRRAAQVGAATATVTVTQP